MRKKVTYIFLLPIFLSILMINNFPTIKAKAAINAEVLKTYKPSSKYIIVTKSVRGISRLKFQNKNLKSNYIIQFTKNQILINKKKLKLKLPGSSKIYYFNYVIGKNFKGYISSNFTKKYTPNQKITSNQSNQSSTTQTTNGASTNNQNNSIFTQQDLDKINAYRAQAKSIGNGSSPQDIYTSPIVQDGVNIRQLTPTYINNSIEWINFFRNMLGLPSIQDNPNWNQDAQYGATMLDDVNNTDNTNIISHGLVAFNKPSFISDAVWQRGAEATNDGLISSGFDSPYDVVTDFLSDEYNIDSSEGPGHREWLLGNISQVGIGKSGDYNNYKLFETNDNNSYTFPKPVDFPADGVFPFDIVSNTAWSISLPNKYDGKIPSISIHDNTDNTDVSVSNVNTSGTTVDANNMTTFGYGYFGTNIWFTPDPNAIKVNHTYTITMSGLTGMSSPYQYTTKLFDLGIYSSINQ